MEMAEEGRTDGRAVGGSAQLTDGRSTRSAECSLGGKQWPLPTAGAAVAVAERD